MSEERSFAASAILEGLREALQDAEGNPEDGMRQEIVYKEAAKEVRTAKPANTIQQNNKGAD